METTEQTVVEPIMFPAMQSVSVGKLMGSLAKAQAKIVAPRKSRTAKVRSSKGEGSSYEYQYADLEDTIESCKGPLAEVGLAYYHFTMRMPGDARTWVVTRICLGDTDEWIQTALPVGTVGNLQELGGCLTYLQKYNLRMLLGQSGGDRDDDGASATAGAQEDEAILEARRLAAQQKLDAEQAAKKSRSDAAVAAAYASGKFRKLPVDATVAAPGAGPAVAVVTAAAGVAVVPAEVPAAPGGAAPVTAVAPASGPTTAPAPLPERGIRAHLGKLRAALEAEGVSIEVFLQLPQVVKNFGIGASWDALPPDFVGAIMEPAAWERLKAALPPPY